MCVALCIITMPKNKVKKRSKNVSRKQSTLAKVGSMLGGIGGGMLGNPVLGSSIGSSLGSLFGKITGLGSYSINSNTLMTNSGPPVFSTNKEGVVVITKREFVTDVVSSTTFSNSYYELNAGNPGLFPWLSSIAENFEQYKFLGLVFEFKPTSGSAIASTNNSLGTIIMTTNYDVLNDPFTTKREMEAYQFTVASVPSSPCIHPVECKPGSNVLQNLYIRGPFIPQHFDARFYDMGLFQIASAGQQANNITLGELWVSYHVELSKPKLVSPNFSHYTSVNGGLYQYASGNELQINQTDSFQASSVTLPLAGSYEIIEMCSNGSSPGSNASFSSGVIPGTNSALVRNKLADTQYGFTVSNNGTVPALIDAVGSLGSLSSATSSGWTFETTVSVDAGGDTCILPVSNYTVPNNVDLIVTYLGYFGPANSTSPTVSSSFVSIDSKDEKDDETIYVKIKK